MFGIDTNFSPSVFSPDWLRSKVHYPDIDSQRLYPLPLYPVEFHGAIARQALLLLLG